MASSCTKKSLILCCYIIKVLLLLHFFPLNRLNSLFSSACSEFLRDISLVTRTAMTCLANLSSFFEFLGFLFSTLNHTFHSPQHRATPLKMTESQKFLHSPLMSPFCCWEAAYQSRNQTWFSAGGHAESHRLRNGWAGYRELGFPQQIKSSMKPFHLQGTAFMAGFNVWKSWNRCSFWRVCVWLDDQHRWLFFVNNKWPKFQGRRKEQAPLFWLLLKKGLGKTLIS